MTNRAVDPPASLPPNAVGYVRPRVDRPGRLSLFWPDGRVSNTFAVDETLSTIRVRLEAGGLRVDDDGIVHREDPAPPVPITRVSDDEFRRVVEQALREDASTTDLDRVAIRQLGQWALPGAPDVDAMLDARDVLESEFGLVCVPRGEDGMQVVFGSYRPRADPGQRPLPEHRAKRRELYQKSLVKSVIVIPRKSAGRRRPKTVPRNT